MSPRFFHLVQILVRQVYVAIKGLKLHFGKERAVCILRPDMHVKPKTLVTHIDYLLL